MFHTNNGFYYHLPSCTLLHSFSHLLQVSDQDKRLQIEVISLYSVMLSRGLLSLVSVGGPDYFLAAIYSRPVLGAVLWLLPLMACGGLANSQDYQALAECFVEGIVDLNDPGVIAKVLGQLMNVQACQAYLDCHQTKGAWKSWFALDSGQLMFEKQLRSMQRGRVHFRSMAFTSRVSHSSSVHEDAERSDGSILHIAILSEILRMLKSLPVDVEGLESCKRLLRVCLAAALVLVWMPQKNRHDVTTRVLEDIEVSSLLHGLLVVSLIIFTRNMHVQAAYLCIGHSSILNQVIFPTG